MKLTRDGLYRVEDHLPRHIREAVATPWSRTLRARWTGEKRPPRKGEWYLSGNPIEAYQAPTDYLPSMVYHIAELVEIEQVEVVKRVL